MKKILCTLFFFLYSSFLIANNHPPQLIVQIVVDQLRGDLLSKYRPEFGPGGFNYLFEHGINYQNTHHPHAYTVTCVGHATIATGSSPSLHGIISNDWYDPRTKKVVYCTEDAKNPILPTIRSKNSTDEAGQSPNQLTASTFSDELVLAQRGRAFGVSLKDRAAITLAGHAGKAFWFDKKHGGFETSQYYYSHYPLWVDQWNSAYQPKDEIWALMNPINTYHFAKVTPIQHHFKGFGAKFPHTLGKPNSPTYYQYFTMSPFADEVTADFAIALLKEEQLGKSKEQTDYLAVSFSVVDIIGHQFGPNSLESEDNLRHLDQTIAKLLKEIDQQVGLQNTVIVLTADHGITDSPNWLTQNHLQTSPGLNIQHLQQSINEILLTRYKLPADAIEFIKLPYVYLNHALLAKNKLSVAEVSRYLAEGLRREPGLFNVYPLPLTQSQQDWLSIKVAKMSYPSRAGDLFVVPNPYQDITDPGWDVAITHGSPWNYDSYVPLLFVNPNYKPTRITREVHTTDIAVTLTELLAIKPPSSSIGTPLEEITKMPDLQ